VTSWKLDDSPPRQNRYVSAMTFWAALVLTSLGFVFQFIGCRGLYGSIALYQLALTLFMFIVRAGLRSRRLPRDSNALEGQGRGVEGHELDWQALRLEEDVKRTREPAERGFGVEVEKRGKIVPLRLSCRNRFAKYSAINI